MTVNKEGSTLFSSRDEVQEKYFMEEILKDTLVWTESNWKEDYLNWMRARLNGKEMEGSMAFLSRVILPKDILH
jgi:hypothetical protein